MPTTFQSYDINRDNIISPDEWAQFYPDMGGPAQQPASIGSSMPPFGQSGLTPDTVAQPAAPTKPAGMPDAIWDIIAPYYGYTPDPDAILGIGQAQVNMDLQQMLAEQQYQQDFLALKQAELGLSQQQVEQAKKEFEFQSGEYWDFFSGDYFEFQKQIEANKVLMSNNQVSMSNNQVLQSEQDVDKSKNYALAQQYQTDAAKAQSDAAKLQAYAAMGLVNLNPPRQPRQDIVSGAGNPFRY